MLVCGHSQQRASWGPLPILAKQGHSMESLSRPAILIAPLTIPAMYCVFQMSEAIDMCSHGSWRPPCVHHKPIGHCLAPVALDNGTI